MIKINRHFRAPCLVGAVSNPDGLGSRESGQADAVRFVTAPTGVIARIFPYLGRRGLANLADWQCSINSKIYHSFHGYRST